MEDLGFEASQDAHGLRVALKTSDITGDFGERTLPVMPERRMTQVMGQASAINHIRVTAQHRTDLAADLGDFQSVGESGAGEIVGAGDQNLAFRA